MSTNATPTTEIELREVLSEAIRAGYPERGVLAYRRFIGAIESAETFLLALRAATDNAESLNFVDRVAENAIESTGYQELWLNIHRQLALYYAIVERDRNLATAKIYSIKDVRPKEHPESRGDDLANWTVLLFGGNHRPPLHYLRQLYSWQDMTDDFSQECLDIEWWTFVAAILCGEGDLSRKIARFSLSNKREGSEDRLRFYKLASKRFRRPRNLREEIVARYKL